MAVTRLDWLLYHAPNAVPTENGGRYELGTQDNLPTMCPEFYDIPGAPPDEVCPDIYDACDRCKECWSHDITGLLDADEAERVGEYVRGLREGWDRGLACLKNTIIRQVTGVNLEKVDLSGWNPSLMALKEGNRHEG